MSLTVREALEILSECDPDAVLETHTDEQDVCGRVTNISQDFNTVGSVVVFHFDPIGDED